MIAAGTMDNRDVRAQGRGGPRQAIVIDDDVIARVTRRIPSVVQDTLEFTRLATAFAATDPSAFPGERALGDRGQPFVRRARIGGWRGHERQTLMPAAWRSRRISAFVAGVFDRTLALAGARGSRSS